MTTYDEQIISILAKVGQRGMSVKKIGMQLYNLNCTLFHTPDFKEIHKYVQQFLVRNSKTPQSLVSKTQWGIYKLNPNSAQARQLEIDFRKKEDADKMEQEEEEEQRKDAPDLSLSLFDDCF
ncbi:MAG: hypothetical protein ACI4T5_09345 [Prevotella sp.]